ncbi:MAG: hypothetical protein K6F55_01900, partial [Eubacterium sp.]|nr:hypothetical protein [Eubacterium sp.]
MKITKIKIAFCITAIVACITACLFGVYKSQASTNFPDYKQTLYNQDNGLGINEINALYQAKSGYIWVGTEGGLYRFNGKEFKLYNLWDTEKEDVYYINDIFQDSKDRLWVCTNNFGLFYIDSGVTTHFTDDYYNGVKSINTICETEKGVLYVATSSGLFTVNEVSNELVYVERLEKHNVQDLTYSHGKLWGIYNGNMIFCIDENGVLHEEDASSFSDEELSTITSDENGTVYVGTIANDILKFSDFDNVDLLYSNVDGINNIYINNDRIYVCADSGIGFFNKIGNFSVIKGLGIQTYFTDMLKDYEGNLWMSSKKYGVLYMSHGKFSNINRKYGLEETGVNAVAKFKDNTYLCTDEGLIIINKKGKILDNEITKYLEGTSIKDIIRDKNNNIWIATYRKNGVVKYSPSGDIVNYNKSKGLISNLVNSIYELNNGNIAVCTEDGLCIIGADGAVKTTYDQENGLDYPSIISLYENEKGVIYAGSDGGGLYVIDGDNITNYTQDDGLNSNVITCITEGKNGLWIGTNNGLTYYNDIFRVISNIDFSNSITSIFSKDDLIYIVGSKGLIYATEDELLGTAA